jgi:peptide/nickel transport system permease protein
VKAVILARGLGKRMRQTDDAASIDASQAAVADRGIKAMIPIGRPFLDYVLSALALGAGKFRVLVRHALPHTISPVLAAATLGVGYAITLEAGLSFLGLGVQPPTASWGPMIASGRETVVNAPWIGLAPGIALVIVVVACTLIADSVSSKQ